VGSLLEDSSDDVAKWRRLSLWWDGLSEQMLRRPVLASDIDVDVAIVGGGFSGLWSAYSLLERDPTLRVAVLEKEVAGFGASGRNGGWVSALFPTSDARLVADYGLDAARRMRMAMFNAVDIVGEVAAREGIDCRYQKGGTIVAARSQAQLVRAQEEVNDAFELGVIGKDDLVFLSSKEAANYFHPTNLLGATYTPHCAAIDPARLARGLALGVEKRGGVIYEGTRVEEIVPRKGATRPSVRCEGGIVRADVVVRASEGWSATFRTSHRDVIPVYSLMVATEPLSPSMWSEIGLEKRTTFSDHRHLIIYGQRTADGRIAFGGRGAPYHFGSRINERFDLNEVVQKKLIEVVIDMFPALKDATFTHRWGGPLGVARDWMASVGYDRTSGVAWAGGYIGDGVSTTNLAGRTLADLILNQKSDLVTLPWVTHRSKKWEPEPLRWIGVNAGLSAMTWADARERKSGKPSRIAEIVSTFLGG